MCVGGLQGVHSLPPTKLISFISVTPHLTVHLRDISSRSPFSYFIPHLTHTRLTLHRQIFPTCSYVSPTCTPSLKAIHLTHSHTFLTPSQFPFKLQLPYNHTSLHSHTYSHTHISLQPDLTVTTPRRSHLPTQLHLSHGFTKTTATAHPRLALPQTLLTQPHSSGSMVIYLVLVLPPGRRRKTNL
ncbi:hypothetical protein E2C01_038691 [Portunus trituberculatus]|uniref:Uncharacterized protein n=1 Tax=Portunus trituberculatus TaxID=210409 RepID=A0A5B7FJ73_PORTR|nr:hypothetical protein [Portunus trituberculatus]